MGYYFSKKLRWSDRPSVNDSISNLVHVMLLDPGGFDRISLTDKTLQFYSIGIFSFLNLVNGLDQKNDFTAYFILGA